MNTAMWVTIGLSVASAALGIATAWVARSTSAKDIQGKYPVSNSVREAAAIFDEWLRAGAPPPERRRAEPVLRGLLVDLFMPPDRADDVLYNLLGRYDYWIEKHGVRWARVIFFVQSAGSIVTFWTDWLLKRLKLLKTFVSK
jgi:hypothetical protein